ncbi:MAG: hypothetical protein IJ499_00630, partial [Clostridia bacterium]|nr:hypothetical protein [Clostridia bacterium]
LLSLATALVAIIGVVIKVNSSLVQLTDAVKELRAFMEKQERKNSKFYEQLNDLETRVTIIEKHYEGE